ncbi:succinate dehydrogenase cytochrome b subunit [Actinomadura sp. PM05-2]|uniref:Succinate dehydrogenase cytochrome b subunit n=2 Tax=Actinomadura parmotrematis TaxID=2864039 RepID=A0ABS7FNA1_9ACTN|nr:succinate dehydrogenase cytochrome b subunit [Actinomadura parmotrematis]
MAVTGGILVLFLVAHMVGNLKIFLGAGDFNHYAEWLRTAGEPAVPHRTVLTLTEVVLTLAVLLHIWSATSLALRARAARPVKYESRKKSHARGYATHTMRYGGVIIALFIIWHLLDLTFYAVNPLGSSATPYDRVIADFAPDRWYITVWYVVAVLLVGLHLWHGAWSAFNSLGWRTKRNDGFLRGLAAVLAVVIAGGFVAVPIAVTFGWVG